MRLEEGCMKNLPRATHLLVHLSKPITLAEASKPERGPTGPDQAGRESLPSPENPAAPDPNPFFTHLFMFMKEYASPAICYSDHVIFILVVDRVVSPQDNSASPYRRSHRSSNPLPASSKELGLHTLLPTTSPLVQGRALHCTGQCTSQSPARRSHLQPTHLTTIQQPRQSAPSIPYPYPSQPSPYRSSSSDQSHARAAQAETGLLPGPLIGPTNPQQPSSLGINFACEQDLDERSCPSTAHVSASSGHMVTFWASLLFIAAEETVVAWYDRSSYPRQDVAALDDKVTGRQCLESTVEGLANLVPAKDDGMPVLERERGDRDNVLGSTEAALHQSLAMTRMET
ncbi:hypothetical protein CC78DRAFT_574601 [Lojkania enalia]|uniref:Uncharacterized protein n=1 Tax=Lojkania enalia TaxID=147567 RepID=A0A9P4NAN3_9PLEO|nr:hypothetical protein CC78DRAFT_574601 [Didymosphaeria enalia]